MIQRRLVAAVAYALLAVVPVPLGVAEPVGAQTYPDGTVRIIVPTAPGGSIDTTARVVASSPSSGASRP